MKTIENPNYGILIEENKNNLHVTILPRIEYEKYLKENGKSSKQEF